MSPVKFSILPLLVLGGALSVSGCCPKTPPTREVTVLTCPPNKVEIKAVDAKHFAMRMEWTAKSQCAPNSHIEMELYQGGDSPKVYVPLAELISKYGPLTFVSSTSDSGTVH